MVNLKYLQKLLFLLVMGFSISMVCACSDNDDDDEPVQAPYYYVMYEIKAKNPKSDYSYNNYSRSISGYYIDSSKEKSRFSMSISPGETEYWEGVYGPFEKGDTVLLEFDSSSSMYSNLVGRARIYVQEGDDGTFVIKKESHSFYSSLTYIVGSY